MKTSKKLKRCVDGNYKQILQKYVPILAWLPKYSLEDLKGDFIAGFTVGLTVVPQGLALAQLANLPPQYGLYTAFMGSFMYAVFGTCKDLVIGPTSVMAIMTAEYALIGGPVYASLLAFFCGCFQLVLGIFNLGFLMNFISSPVLSGFTAAAAIISATMQLKGLFGLKFESRGFINTVYNFFLHLSYINFYDTMLGISSVLFLLLLRHYKDCKSTCMKGSSVFRGLWWLFATARNAILVIVCSLFASILLSLGKNEFALTQHVDAGIPKFQFPQFSLQEFGSSENVTMSKNFMDILKDLGSGAIVIPFISLLEAIAIAKTFTKGEKLLSSREMIALGMGNLMGSFVSSYPVTGSFSRSVINNTSGVRTPLGGIFSGSFVLLALCIIAPLFHYIPKACLSAIIFSAVIFMIHLEDVPIMWRENRVELIPFSTTFFGSFVFGLEYGLLFGITAALAILLWKQNRTPMSISVKRENSDRIVIHVTPRDSIYFPSTDKFKGAITKALYTQTILSKCTVILHGENIKELDHTTLMGMKNMIKSFRKDGVQIIFHITEPAAMRTLLYLKPYSVVLCEREEEVQLALLNNSNNKISDSNSIEECSEVIVESSSATALLSTASDEKADSKPETNE